MVSLNRSIVFSVGLLLSSVADSVLAQEDYQKWLEKEQSQYKEYTDKRDRDFLEFLDKEWRGMQLMQGVVADEKPKPVKIPVHTPPVTVAKDTVAKTPPIRIPMAEPKPHVLVAPEKPSVDTLKNRSVLTVVFFGTPVTLRYDQQIRARLGGDVKKESISAFWSAMSRSHYDGILKEAQYHQDIMKLNDWGYCLLLERIGEKIFSADRNELTLFVWFMLAKSGYAAKVGYSGNRVFLLLPTKNRLFDIPFLTYSNDQRRFYAVTLGGSGPKIQDQIYTYDGAYPNAEKSIDFSIAITPRLRSTPFSRLLKFRYGEQDYPVQVEVDRDAVNFFAEYPQTNFEVYFSAPPSQTAAGSLLAAFKPIVLGKSETEAVNIILRFVQTAFGYKTDPENFGKEKPLFPDETLYYDYSDCEDRAILFAYLVRSLTGLEVIGLDYPGHIASAVRFSSDVPGDSVVYRGSRFVICDPTYINADAGVCMPNLKGVEAKAIVLHNSN